MKPGLNAEKAGHFRHPTPNGGIVHAKAFQTKSQLMPNLIGDDLAVRVLKDKADPGGLGTVIHFFQGDTVKKNRTFPFAVRRKNSL